MLRALGILVVGMVLGGGLLVSGSLYLESQGAPTPESVCDDHLGAEWNPDGVNIDRSNESVTVTCVNGDRVEYVTVGLNVMDDVGASV